MNPHCEPDPLTGRCITCADAGIEGRVLALQDGALAQVEMEGDVHEVALDLLDGVAVGDRVLVHAGVAIAHLGSEA
jgi:hydrogenase maturation factor